MSSHLKIKNFVLDPTPTQCAKRKCSSEACLFKAAWKETTKGSGRSYCNACLILKERFQAGRAILDSTSVRAWQYHFLTYMIKQLRLIQTDMAIKRENSLKAEVYITTIENIIAIEYASKLWRFTCYFKINTMIDSLRSFLYSHKRAWQHFILPSFRI